MILNVLLLILGLFILILGGDFLVRGASNFALRLRISPLVIGLTVVAFGTSAPELLISVKAALSGSPDLTMGNVIGSNICNLALVLGVTAVIGPIRVNKDSVSIDWPVAMGSGLLLYLIVLTGSIKYYEGIAFILLLILYTTFIIRKSRKESISSTTGDSGVKVNSKLWRDILFFLLGCIGLYFGSEWFVGGAKELARFLGVGERVIGITVLALGTSLPELVTAMVAAFKRETDLALGNLIGSNIFNVLSILGITSILKEIHISDVIMNIDMLWMLGITLIIFPMMLHQRRVSRSDGVVLLMVYVYYTYTVVS